MQSTTWVHKWRATCNAKNGYYGRLRCILASSQATPNFPVLTLKNYEWSKDEVIVLWLMPSVMLFWCFCSIILNSRPMLTSPVMRMAKGKRTILLDEHLHLLCGNFSRFACYVSESYNKSITFLSPVVSEWLFSTCAKSSVILPFTVASQLHPSRTLQDLCWSQCVSQ